MELTADDGRRAPRDESATLTGESSPVPHLAGDGVHLTDRRFTRLPTPLGDLVVAVADEGVFGAYFDGQKHQPEPEWFGREVTPDALPSDPLLAATATQLTEYFASERDDFDVPMAPLGTPFQRSVWEQLVAIPLGSTRTYGSISATLSPGDATVPGLAQGVGQAVGHNPISVIVPCHRVVGSDGSLTGFAGGLDRKRWLLAREETQEAKDARLF